MLIYHLEMNNRPVGGRSSETKSRPIDVIIIVLTLHRTQMELTGFLGVGGGGGEGESNFVEHFL
jgi:hypothetical protein